MNYYYIYYWGIDGWARMSIRAATTPDEAVRKWAQCHQADPKLVRAYPCGTRTAARLAGKKE